ncbi:TPA: hypothetical protein PCO36_000378 [Klebsiella oxytoca]|nr:hypothetical protein [Klebsiella oxytoca]
MTDITELAQSLKAAAENAIGAHERLAAYPYGEIIDISQHEGEQIDIDITDLNEFNKEANPVNILALVEALEKAQKSNEFLKGQLSELANFNPDWDKLEASYESWREIAAELLVAKERIAELESRTRTAAASDVLAERQRQVTAEGWTPEHDDEHSDGEMALAASSYALYAHKKPIAPAMPYNWPWEPEWFKQQGARRDLVKAGALILAEIERLDRAAGIKVEIK